MISPTTSDELHLKPHNVGLRLDPGNVAHPGKLAYAGSKILTANNVRLCWLTYSDGQEWKAD